jgi:hypothetical protein
VTIYRAVVKYPIDADEVARRRALREGLDDICMELVGELGASLDELEGWLEDARSAAELEVEMKERAS